MPVKEAPFPGINQIAYVTNDMARATTDLSDLHGCGPFLVVKQVTTITNPGSEATLNLAFAYIGAVEIEVIEPLSGDIGVWRDILPPEGYALRLHHISSLFEDEASYEAMRQRMIRMCGGLTFDTTGETGRRFYADCRSILGHYVEGTLPGEPVKRTRGMIPRY